VASAVVITGLASGVPAAQAASTAYFTASGVGSLPAATSSEAAAPLPDGQVLIAGGDTSAGVVATADLFDPAIGTFTQLAASMTAARAGAVAAPLLDGAILIAGGLGSGGVLASAELFKPATDTFTALAASMTTARVNAVAAPLRS
jgi:hypothetical protein